MMLTAAVIDRDRNSGSESDSESDSDSDLNVEEAAVFGALAGRGTAVQRTATPL